MEALMEALVKTKPGPGLLLAQMPIPEIAPDEILIKIKNTALCGTDLHIYEWDDWAARTLHPPLIIGHEFMGEIAQVGSMIKHLQVGQRVSGEGHLTCGICHNCRSGLRYLCPNTKGIGSHCNGAFAEYLVLPAINVIPLPESISDDIATILDPLGNALHSTLAFDIAGEDILITGAGPIGLMAGRIAQFIGAKRIFMTDINDYRLDLAKKLGLEHALNIRHQTLDDYLSGFSPRPELRVGLEMSGNEQAIQSQLEHLYHGAKMILLGIPSKSITMNLDKIIFKGLTVKGIYGRKMFETWESMIALLEAGLDVSQVITHHFPARDYEKAFELIKTGQAGKVILNWS